MWKVLYFIAVIVNDGVGSTLFLWLCIGPRVDLQVLQGRAIIGGISQFEG